jgi:hypothetical protein
MEEVKMKTLEQDWGGSSIGDRRAVLADRLMSMEKELKRLVHDCYFYDVNEEAINGAEVQEVLTIVDKMRWFRESL